MDHEDEARRRQIIEDADAIINSGRYSIHLETNNSGSLLSNTQLITGTILASILALGTAAGFMFSTSNKD